MTGPRRHVVVGTAGHIDHGKSTLVKALTGTDPDRLAEEKLRGITIDLGFAHTDLGGITFSFVDVPGHEKFVHNMLAGATGIDLVMLVVAADEAVMPQTREHLAICRLLGLTSGVVALTRVDLAERELVDLAETDVRETIAGTGFDAAPIVRVSGKTGRGLDALARALEEAAGALPAAERGPWPRLPVDRVFAVKGFGTVVTGTLQGGSLAVGETLSIVPGSEDARIRGLQVHGVKTESAGPSRRVAVNLQGVDKSQVHRGHVLTPRGLGTTTRVLDAEVEVLEDAVAPLSHGQRVRIHHGTAEIFARLRLPAPGELAPGARGAAQLRLESELAALPGDPFIIRRYSPLVTLGGGRIADLDPPRWRRKDPAWPERTRRFARATPEERLGLAIEEAGPRGVSPSDRAARLGLHPLQAAAWCREKASREDAPLIVLGGVRAVSTGGARTLLRDVGETLGELHREDPLDPGPAPEQMRSRVAPDWEPEAFRALLERFAVGGELVVESGAVRLATHEPVPRGELQSALARIVAILDEAGLDAPGTDELLRRANVGRSGEALVVYAARNELMIRIAGDRWIGASAWRRVVDRLRRRAQSGERDVDIATFKELFSLTRKTAIPLLERLDDAGVTRRVGDKRRIMTEGAGLQP